jgi:hypothetical protein
LTAINQFLKEVNVRAHGELIRHRGGFV